MRAKLLALLFVSAPVWATQVIDCPAGTAVKQDPTVFAKITIDKNKARLVSNQNNPGSESDKIDEVLVKKPDKQTDPRPKKKSISFISDSTVAANDNDFDYTVSFLRTYWEKSGKNLTVYILSHSFEPDENGASFSVKYESCTSTVK